MSEAAPSARKAEQIIMSVTMRRKALCERSSSSMYATPTSRQRVCESVVIISARSRPASVSLVWPRIWLFTAARFSSERPA